MTTGPAQATTPFIITPHMNGQPLGLFMDIREDPDHQLELEDILIADQNGAFRPSTQDVPNFGLRRGAQWVKFKVHNPLDHAVTILLEQKFTFMDSFELYYQTSSSRWQKKVAGDQQRFATRDIPSRQAVFRLTLDPGSHQFYGRSFADGAHQLPLHIWTQDEFFSHNAREYGVIGLLIGFHVVICFYNLFLYLSLRDRTYLYYVIYVSFNVIYQTSGLGILQQTLSHIGLAETLDNRFVVMSVDIIAITALLFSYHFLDIRQRLPAFRLMYIAIGTLALINIANTLFISAWLGTAMCLLTASFATSALILSGLLIARQRYVPGMFFLAGWSCYLLGVTGTVTNLVGLLPTSNFSRWGQFTGGAIEIAILSLALGARINAKRRQTLHMIQELNQELENKVEERTTEIQSLLRHIPQGILSIGREGRISPNYSAQLPSILGLDDIAGRSFRSLILDRSNLSADEKDQAWQTIQASVGEHSLNFDLNTDKLPAQLSYTVRGMTKDLRLTWNRELNAQDEVKHILVTLLDISSEVAAQHEVERQNQEFDIIRQLVDCGSRKSIQFFSAGDQLIEENERLVHAPNLDADTVKILFVNTHTLKGAARSLSFRELADALHTLEAYYVLILKSHHPIKRDRLQHEFKVAYAVYQRYQRANRETLGRNDDLRKVTVERDVLQDHVKLLRQLAGFDGLPRDLKGLIQSRCEEMATLVFTNLPSLLSELRPQADKIAQDLGRECPIFIVETADIRITYGQELALKNAFIHILRNALDHGIEPAAIRLAKGKDPRGTLSIQAMEKAGQIIIEFKDDGQGLDLTRIRELCHAASRKETRSSPQDLASMIFESGFSTSETVSLTSGRGVGLTAVRQFMEAEQGTVSLVLGQRLTSDRDLHEFIIRLTLPVVASPVVWQTLTQAS